MSLDGYRTVLVLGGIRSGKSEFAESLVSSAGEVRYAATASAAPGAAAPDVGAAADSAADPAWTARIAAHRGRRPATWSTEETAGDPDRLADLVAGTSAGQAVLVDDLGCWLTEVLDAAGWDPAGVSGRTEALLAAVGAGSGRVVLVSPEVGLSVVPATDSGRIFADALGALNQRLAAACDAVVLVVAGQPCWLKGGVGRIIPAGQRTVVTDSAGRSADAAPAGATAPEANAEPVTGMVATAQPTGGTIIAGGTTATGSTETTHGTETGGEETDATVPPGGSPREIGSNLDLPLPDEAAGEAAAARLADLDLPGAGLGRLSGVVRFAGAVRGSATPGPFRSVRVLLLHGTHTGGVAAGDSPERWAARVDRAGRGEGPLASLAARADAALRVVDARAGDDGMLSAGAIEDGDALDAAAVEAALRRGWQLADDAVDEGADLLVLAAGGAGQEAAGVALIAATTFNDPAALLPRVLAPAGRIDDDAWMARMTAVREALRRSRERPRDARSLLAALAGSDIAIAVGLLLGATARRTPVMVDGPVGVAAGLLARDLSTQSRRWLLLADDGGHPAVAAGADALGLEPVADLRLGIGEGGASLALLPLVQAALTLADPAAGG